MEKYVIVVGTVVAGIDEIVGPFDGYQKAAEYIDNNKESVDPSLASIVSLERDYRELELLVEPNAPRSESELVLDIQRMLSGKEWTPDTVQDIADLLNANGYEIKESEFRVDKKPGGKHGRQSRKANPRT